MHDVRELVRLLLHAGQEPTSAVIMPLSIPQMRIDTTPDWSLIRRMLERARLSCKANGSLLQNCLQRVYLNVYEYSGSLDTAQTIIIDISKPKVIPIIPEDAFHASRFLPSPCRACHASAVSCIRQCRTSQGYV